MCLYGDLFRLKFKSKTVKLDFKKPLKLLPNIDIKKE